MEKAYLVQLEGMGDRRWYLLNEAHWKVLDALDEGEDVTPPEDMLAGIMEDLNCDREDALDVFVNRGSSTYSNDVALNLAASKFNGEKYEDWDSSVKALNAFVKKHNLDFEEAYEGYIY